jgi:uncharacterized protein YdbL (DUF1318 family)
MKALTIALTGLFCLTLALTAVAQDDEITKLKARFKARYPTLKKLKDAGKVGETTAAKVEAVKAAYLEEKAAGEKTVKTFLAEENKDRQRLYILMAKQAETTPEKVVERNAKRNFSKADPNHYLKLKSGKWLKKKDYKR